jgi:hypothetical protein
VGVSRLSKLPNAHFIHPQVFVDIGGKGEWKASHLGFKLISLYTEEGDEISEKLQGIYQLLTFLWAEAKQFGTPVTLRETPESGEVTALCDRKAAILSNSSTHGNMNAPGLGEAMNDSKCLTEAMVLNLNKSSEAYV